MLNLIDIDNSLLLTPDRYPSCITLQIKFLLKELLIFAVEDVRDKI